VRPLRRLAAVAFLSLSFCPVAAAETLLLEIKQATSRVDEYAREPVIEIVLGDESARRVADVTTRNIGAQAEIRIDGEAVLKPVIREPLLHGIFMISGRFNRQQATAIAARLASHTAKLEFVVQSAD
jgi:preprotein translocase subunit SecD